MFKSEKGYGTAEALVAISAIFMVMGMFIPLVIGVLTSLEKKESNFAAARVLYEHLEEETFSGQTVNSSYQRNGTTYHVLRKQGTPCIKFTDYSGKNQSRCLNEDVND
jgi:hypothetical protein